MGTTEKLKYKLVTACRILDAEGIMDEVGHLSVRIPGEDLVLMNGKVSPGQATEEDMVLLDLNGVKIEGKLEPAKEIPLHLSVYQRRTDVMAVAHTHSPTIVVLSIVGVRLRAVDFAGAVVFGAEEVPLYEGYGLVDTFDMGHNIAEALGSHNIIVLKSHGNLVIGKSIEEACLAAIWAEKAARLQYQAMQIGQPDWYPKEEIEKIRSQVIDGKASQRAWSYYQSRLNR